MNSFSRITRLVSAGTILAAFPVIAVAAAHNGAPDTTRSVARSATCPRGWGSLPEVNRQRAQGTLVGVRSGRHSCYDRLVLDVAGRQTGYWAQYVRQVRMDGSGHLVPLRGGARLEIIASVPAYDLATSRPTYLPANPRELTDTRGYRTFRQVAWAGSFEGQTTIGLGVRARLPFRTFTLPGPGNRSRIVIDVAHTW